VYATDVNSVMVAIYDGVGTSYSNYHSGGGGWEFLSVTRVIDNAATRLWLQAPYIWNPITTPITAYADGAILKIGSSVSPTDANEPFDAANQTPFRYWRRKISGTLSAAPYAAICIWGLKTELDYATVSFDPHAQTSQAEVNLSMGGYVTGIHERYVERSMDITIHNADATLYNKLKTWWETSGMKNFFIAWDYTNNPSDVFLMRPDPKFNNPFRAGGTFRDLTLKLKGRRE